PLSLYRHQREAVEAARTGDSYVLTTGTGSGKSLSYIIPIVDRVLREREREKQEGRRPAKRTRAIIVYPMNALANSQLEELKKYLEYGYGKGREPVTFARYTGQEGEQRRKELRDNPPDILLTNYVMLELMLTRPGDRKSVIASAKGLDFLVFDELHTYRGRQGADVALPVAPPARPRGPRRRPPAPAPAHPAARRPRRRPAAAPPRRARRRARRG